MMNAVERPLIDRLFNELIHSVFIHAGGLATGIILLLSVQAMQSGEFTVGDFALFVNYLTGMTFKMSFAGLAWARYKQAGVSVQRLEELVQGAPTEEIVKSGPIYQDGHLPDVPVPTRTHEDRLQELTINNLTYVHPESGRGIENVNLSLPPRLFHGHHWAHRCGQNDAAARLAGFTAAGYGRYTVERQVCCRAR